jgi:MoxR-like ATPase
VPAHAEPARAQDAPTVISQPAGTAPPAAAPRLAEAPPPAPRRASGFLDPNAIRAAAEGQGLRLPSAAYASVAAALASGRHLVLTGPAGSGKTALALAIARAAVTAGRASGAVLVTPTQRWSSGDALGRRARADGTPATAGKVPDSATRGKWLVIDELDRARADKALGGLSTFLGGLPVTLPGGEEVKPPEDWRVIATAASPVDASPALLRRFAHVEVPFPAPDDMTALLERAAGGDPVAANAAGRLLSLRELRTLGAGVFITAAAHAAERNAIEPADERTLARETYTAYVEPLMSGLDDRGEDRLKELLGAL